MAADSPLSPLPPALSFSARLARANGLHEQNFQAWSWRAGMHFGATHTWWGTEAARPRPHEGLDLGPFVDADGRPDALGAGARVPVLYPGQVVAIFADFLGQSIMIAHPLRQGEWRLHSVYAHVIAEAGVAVGHHCHERGIIARVAPSPKPGIPPHLHLSTLWLSGTLPDTISWPWISAAATIRLCDPLEFINLPEPLAAQLRYAE